MRFELENANAVFVANQFNPSVVSQFWLVDNGLVEREDFLPGCIFSDMVVNAATKRFNLFVTPPQLQFVPHGDSEGQLDTVKLLARFVELLPHTPISAIGLNFTWHVMPGEGENVPSISRQLFFRPDQDLFRQFDVPGARYGGYFSRDELGFRLKLDIKPVTLATGENREERIQFAFNFHCDITPGDGVAKKIRELLESWDKARDITAETMSLLPKEIR